MGTRSRTRKVLGLVSVGLSAGLLSGLLGACGGTGGSAGSEAVAPGTRDTASKPLDTAPKDAAGGDTATPTVLWLDRSIIRTVTLRVRADDVPAAARQAWRLTEAAGGLVAGEQTVTEPDDPGRASSMLTLRVPGDRLAGLLEDLSDLGIVLTQDQTTTDVTGQVIDVESRLSTQRTSVERVRALLAQAKTIGEIVQVEAELTRREADLEALQAQVKQLGDQTALATVTLSLIGPKSREAGSDDGFVPGLKRGWDAFVATTIWLVTALGTVLPFLVLGLLVALARIILLRRARRLTTPPAPPTPAPPAPAPPATP